MSIVKFINGYNDKPEDVKDIHDYLSDDLKTENGKYIKGIGFITDSYLDEIYAVKTSNQKTNGNQYEQVTISITPANNQYSNEDIVKIGEKIGEFYHKKGHQLVVYLHLDTDTRHLHLLLNSVNYLTGKKFSQSKKELNRFKLHCNHVFDEYGLDTIKKTTEDMQDYTKHSIQSGYEFLELFDEIMADKAEIFSDLFDEKESQDEYGYTNTCIGNIYDYIDLNNISTYKSNMYAPSAYGQNKSQEVINMSTTLQAPNNTQVSNPPCVCEPGVIFDYSRNININVSADYDQQKLTQYINNIEPMTEIEKANNTKIGIAATAELSNMGYSAPIYVNNSTNININFNNPPDDNNIVDIDPNLIK